ncbi:MAG: hypothetical protein IJC04_08500 [Oscillospiraceae bacterium]|nr:hypothetical protein [Oscillospiraceae bacterium]
MNTQIEETVVNELPQASAAETVHTNAQPAKKKMPAAVRFILCILLAVLLIADVIAIAAVTTVRTVVTEKNIEKLIDYTDYMTIPLTIDNIQSNLYEMFFIAFANSETDIVDIYKLAEDTNFEGLIAEHLYNYAAFILYDKRLDGINSEDIKTFYVENLNIINNAFNVTYSRDEVFEIIEEQDEIYSKLTNNEIEAAIPMIGLIRFVMSPGALIIFGVLAVVLIVFIGVISRSVGTALVVTGISATATGLAGAVASCLAIFGSIGISPTPVTAASVIWQGVVSALLSDVCTLFVYILTAGILLILTGGFIGQIRRNLRRAKNS